MDGTRTDEVHFESDNEALEVAKKLIEGVQDRKRRIVVHTLVGSTRIDNRDYTALMQLNFHRDHT